MKSLINEVYCDLCGFPTEWYDTCEVCGKVYCELCGMIGDEKCDECLEWEEENE